MKKLAITVAAIVLATGTAANAQWIYSGKESAFDNDTLHMALTSKAPYGLGFRCRGSKIEIVYLTPDTSFDEDTYKMANITLPKLRVRVDKDPIIDVDVELSDAEGKVVAVGIVDLSLLESVKAAKSRVAVVLQLLSDSYHEQSFNVRGSGKAISQIIDGCGLSED